MSTSSTNTKSAKIKINKIIFVQSGRCPLCTHNELSEALADASHNEKHLLRVGGEGPQLRIYNTGVVDFCTTELELIRKLVFLRGPEGVTAELAEWHDTES